MRLAGQHTRALEPPRLGVACGAGAASLRTERDEVAWLLVEGGVGTLTVGGETAAVDGRENVFEGPGWAAVIGPDETAELGDGVRWIVAWRQAEGRSMSTRVIAPGDVVVERRGSGSSERLVRTYLADGPLIAGETINEAGGWSSYPPHRHEQEEVYLYRFSPPHGFGVAIEYDDSMDQAAVVREGSVQRIRSGYHPVVAAPDARMAYVWVLAGESDTLTPEFDPTFDPPVL